VSQDVTQAVRDLTSVVDTATPVNLAGWAVQRKGAVVVGVPGQVISSDGPVAAAIEGRLEPPLTDPVAASLASILKRLEELEGRETEDTSGRLVGPRADGTWSAAQFEDFSI